MLVSGSGEGGQDEAVLFISRLTDNTLKWHGWMAVKGGFSGARLGGIKPFVNQFQGYSLYVPQNFEISLVDASSVDLMAGMAGHAEEPAAAFIFVEPANGRTAGQVVEAAIAELGAGNFQITIDPVLRIEDTVAFVVNGLPGQDVNRQLFMVHNDQLYRIMFMPTNTNSPAYPQVEDIYAMVVNTLHFTK